MFRRIYYVEEPLVRQERSGAAAVPDYQMYTTFELQSNRQYLPRARYAEIPLMVRVRVKDDAILSDNRRGVDLVLVIDVSGSMLGEKIELAKKSLKFAVGNLDRRDRVALVQFSDYATVLSGFTVMSAAGKEKLQNKIENLVANGSTNIRDGFSSAFELIKKRREVNDITSVLLLSDGVDTMGNTMPDFVRIVKDFKAFAGEKRLDCKINTLGYGADHDEEVLSYFSNETQGNFYYVKDAEQISSVVIDAVGALLSAFANDASIMINLGPFSAFVENYGDSWDTKPSDKDLKAMGKNPMTMREDMDKVAIIRLGYLFSGMDKSFVSSISLRMDTDEINNGSPKLVAFGTLSFSAAGQPFTIKQSLSMECRADLGAFMPEVEEQFVRVKSAKVVERARLQSKSGNTEAAASTLNSFKATVNSNNALSGKFKSTLNEILDADKLRDNKQSVQTVSVLARQQFSPVVASARPANSVQKMLTAKFNAQS